MDLRCGAKSMLEGVALKVAEKAASHLTPLQAPANIPWSNFLRASPRYLSKMWQGRWPQIESLSNKGFNKRKSWKGSSTYETSIYFFFSISLFLRQCKLFGFGVWKWLLLDFERLWRSFRGGLWPLAAAGCSDSSSRGSGGKLLVALPQPVYFLGHIPIVSLNTQWIGKKNILYQIGVTRLCGDSFTLCFF